MNSNKYNNKFPSLLDKVFVNDILNWTGDKVSHSQNTLPAVNIESTNKNYLMDVVIPGFEKEAIKIDVHKNILTISSEKETEKEQPKKINYTRKEFNYSSFHRSFTLPKSADIENITATYTNGILHITIGKIEKTSEKKPIAIEIQ